MLKDLALARKQLSSVFANPEFLTPGIVDMYFAPLVASKERIALLQRFGGWQKSQAQLMAVAPQLRASHVPAQLVWGDADTAFDMEPSIRWLRANLGSLEKVVTVAGGNLFFMSERPEALSVSLLEFWEAHRG